MESKFLEATNGAFRHFHVLAQANACCSDHDHHNQAARNIDIQNLYAHLFCEARLISR